MQCTSSHKLHPLPPLTATFPPIPESAAVRLCIFLVKFQHIFGQRSWVFAAYIFLWGRLLSLNKSWVNSCLASRLAWALVFVTSQVSSPCMCSTSAYPRSVLLPNFLPTVPGFWSKKALVISKFGKLKVYQIWENSMQTYGFFCI